MEEQKASWPPAPAEVDRTAEYDAILDNIRASLKRHQTTRPRAYLMMKLYKETKLPYRQCKEILDDYCERCDIPIEKLTRKQKIFTTIYVSILGCFIIAMIALVVALLLVINSNPVTAAERIGQEHAERLIMRMEFIGSLSLFPIIAASLIWRRTTDHGKKSFGAADSKSLAE